MTSALHYQIFISLHDSDTVDGVCLGKMGMVTNDREMVPRIHVPVLA